MATQVFCLITGSFIPFSADSLFCKSFSLSYYFIKLVPASPITACYAHGGLVFAV